MGLAEWGLYPHEMSQDELEHMTVAWMRRKKLEARLIAVEVMKLLSGEAEEEHMTDDEIWEDFVETFRE